MNKGLKSYTKQITQSIDKLVTGSININEKDANLHIIFPLLSTGGLNPIETKLIFDYQNIDKIGFFGKGVNINYFARIDYDGEYAYIFNSDGSIDEFDYRSGGDYFNSETQAIISKVYEGPYQSYTCDIVTDKYGNVFEYLTDTNYPKYIKLKNGERQILDFTASVKTITNRHGDELRFVKNGNVITEAHYYHYNKKVLSSFLNYQDNRLSRIITKKENDILSDVSMTYAINSIVINDNISGKSIKYNLNNKKVISYLESYDKDFVDSRLTRIEYKNNYSTVIDHLGNKTTTFFDSEGFPIFELDNDGNVVENEYDKKTKLLLSKSAPVQIKHKETNLFPDSVKDFSVYNASITKVYCNNIFFKDILGDTVYKVTGKEYFSSIRYSVDFSGLATDEITAIIWGKQLTPKTDNSYVEVRLLAGDSDTGIFSKKVVDDNFSIMVLGTSAEVSFSNIKLDIFLRGRASIEIGGIQVIKKSFGTFYSYDSSNNVTKVGNGGISSSITYYKNNLPETVFSENSEVLGYSYDLYGHPTEIVSSYGTKIKNEYGPAFHSMISSKASNFKGSKILEVKKTYSGDGKFLKTETDELLNKTSYTYDTLGRISTVINALNVVTEIKYNAYGTLENVITKKGSDSSKAVYTYDSKRRLKDIVLKNGSKYTFEYDSRSNIIKISLNNVTLFSYQYDSLTNNIISQKQGNNGDIHLFDYNSDNLIKEIYFKKGEN